MSISHWNITYSEHIGQKMILGTREEFTIDCIVIAQVWYYLCVTSVLSDWLVVHISLLLCAFTICGVGQMTLFHCLSLNSCMRLKNSTDIQWFGHILLIFLWPFSSQHQVAVSLK